MTELEAYIAIEVDKYNGIAFPIKASLLERILLKRVDYRKLHPNPADEFCFPNIGPSYRIISEYVKKYSKGPSRVGLGEAADVALTVEKMYPDGYMILNGHHRWAAYMKLSQKKVPVHIVNLTQESDILKMIKNSKNDKRVTLDLDEVVFASGSQEMEKELIYPFRNIYKERLRKGIPAMFHTIKRSGYDIWVYSYEFYSIDYIRKLFRKYHVYVDGIVTGTARKNMDDSFSKKKVERMIANKYAYTIHVDNNSLIRINSKTKEFEDFEINPDSWSREVIEKIEEIEKNED